MFKRLSCEVVVGSYKFNKIVGVEINSTWEKFTDTCEITLPRKISLNKNLVAGDSLFKRGDSVTVKLGVDGDNKTVFEGYVTEIKPDTPFTLICEDQMFLLKQSFIQPKTYLNTTLKKLLTEIIPSGFQFKTNMDISFSKLILNKQSVASVLNLLKKEYNLLSYFRDGVLNVGLAYDVENQNKYKFGFQKNIISHDLTYKKEEDIKIRVEAVSVLDSKKELKVNVGDEEGDLRSLHFHGIKTESELKSLAEIEIRKLKFEGWHGSFTTFGWLAEIKHGNIVELSDNKLPEKDGAYVCKSIKTSYSNRGYRKEIELNVKVS